MTFVCVSACVCTRASVCERVCVCDTGTKASKCSPILTLYITFFYFFFIFNGQFFSTIGSKAGSDWFAAVNVYFDVLDHVKNSPGPRELLSLKDQRSGCICSVFSDPQCLWRLGMKTSERLRAFKRPRGENGKQTAGL